MDPAPRPPIATLLIVLLLATTAFAGCADDSAPPLDVDAGVPTDEPGGELTDESEVGPPTWEIGDWFGHHVYLPPEGDDQLDFHIDAIVLDDAGGSYKLATDDELFAKVHALIDVPFFGKIEKDDLTMTGLGTTWDLYDFPLSHNKTWTGTFEPPSNVGFGADDAIELTFTSTFDPEIRTVLGAVHPGFQIEAVAGDGTVVLEYDYVPAIGFYAHFFFWDYASEEPDDFFFHAANMGSGENWTGTYYEATATVLIEETSYFFPDQNNPPNGANPNPHHVVTIGEQATSVVGFLWAFAISGTAESVLVDADDNVHEARAVNTEAPEGAEGTFASCEQNDIGFCEWPAVAGEWEVGLGGAAFVHFEGAFLAEVVLTSATL